MAQVGKMVNSPINMPPKIEKIADFVPENAPIHPISFTSPKPMVSFYRIISDIIAIHYNTFERNNSPFNDSRSPRPRYSRYPKWVKIQLQIVPSIAPPTVYESEIFSVLKSIPEDMTRMTNRIEPTINNGD
jgi:hypothetical protein